jgi:hypothetical protein
LKKAYQEKLLVEPNNTQVNHQDEHQDNHQDEHQDKHQDEHQDKHQAMRSDKSEVELTDLHVAVLKALENKPLSRKEIFGVIERNGDSRAFKRYITPLLDAGLIQMTIPDKPNSKNQKYIKVKKNTL